MKKKVFIVFVIIIFISIISYAKYKMDFKIEAIQVITDLEIPMCKISYSTNKYTNGNVDVILEFSEVIKPIEGFEKVDNMKYKKILKSNQTEKIEFFDLVGNSNNIECSVTWIDKESPKIKGIENGKVYDETKKVTYFDNLSGIKNIDKIFYGDLEIGITEYIENKEYIDISIKVLRKPKNINQIIFYKVENGVNQLNKGIYETKYRIKSVENVEFYVKVIDINGKEYKSKIINKNNINEFINNVKKYNNEDKNIFSNPGNYEVTVTDNANNKTEYTIKIEK